MREVKSFSTGALVAIIVVFVIALLSIAGVIIRNNYEFQLKKADDSTNYETKKTVEDYARSLITQYTADKLRYETYKDGSGEQLSWAQEAKIRANTTAALYNEYILKNSFIFKDNIPEDIKSELPYIE